MWKHVSVVAISVAAALSVAKGLSTLHDLNEPPAAPAASAAANGSPAGLVKAADGHFWAEAEVDGHRVRFLVDTGATAVALTLADARRIGLDLARMDFDRTVHTAAGEVKAAEVELSYVSVAGARVDKVRAIVFESGLESSLLGMSYLGRLSGFEASPGQLILRP
jgi:aspartyl protease family protein